MKVDWLIRALWIKWNNVKTFNEHTNNNTRMNNKKKTLIFFCLQISIHIRWIWWEGLPLNGNVGTFGSLHSNCWIQNIFFPCVINERLREAPPVLRDIFMQWEFYWKCFCIPQWWEEFLVWFKKKKNCVLFFWSVPVKTITKFL